MDPESDEDFLESSSSNLHIVTSVSSESDDDSLGLLTDQQINSAWYEDLITDIDPIPSFQKLNFNDASIDEGDLTKTFFPDSELKGEPAISPILCREITKNIDLPFFESTPKIKLIHDEADDKRSALRYSEDFLNKTVKIFPKCDDASVKISEDLEENMLNVTHKIEVDSDLCDEEFSSLNTTYFKIQTLNTTLPLIKEPLSNLSPEEHKEEEEKNIINKTFTEMPKDTETKNHNEKSIENLSSSWTILDSKETSFYPQRSTTETTSSTTGTKKKIFKINKEKKTNSPNVKTVKTKPRRILSIANRDLKSVGSSSAFDTDSMLSTESIDQDIPPLNITICKKNLKEVPKKSLPKTKPFNFTFKAIDSPEKIGESKDINKYREEIILKNEDITRKNFKEVTRAKGYADHKVSAYVALKELERVKNKKQPLKIPTIGLVVEPEEETNSDRKDKRIITGLPRRSRIARPLVKAHGNRRVSINEPHQLNPMSHPTPQRLSLDPSRRSPRRGSRIPTLGRSQAFGPQAIFTTDNPFHPPVRGRSSSIPMRCISRRSPFLK